MSDIYERCSECHWTNVELLNLGDFGKPRWVCHVCCKRLADRLTELRTAVEPLLDEVRSMRDTLSASSLELDLKVADGWNALIKPVEEALRTSSSKRTAPS